MGRDCALSNALSPSCCCSWGVVPAGQAERFQADGADHSAMQVAKHWQLHGGHESPDDATASDVHSNGAVHVPVLEV